MYIYARIFLDFVWELEVGVKFSKLDFVENLYPTETIILFSGIWFFYLSRFAQEEAEVIVVDNLPETVVCPSLKFLFEFSTTSHQ